MTSYDTIHTFPLEDGKFLFFDIFLANSQVIMICPKWVDIINIQVFNEKRETIPLKSCEETLDWHSTGITIAKFDLPTSKEFQNIHVVYKTIENSFCLTENISRQKYSLTMTTLFKNDFYLLDKYISYYTNQGIEHFYLYYNGLFDDFKNKYVCLENPNITWLEWNHEYHIDGDSEKGMSHAQFSQMNHALLKYGGLTEYMGFNDLDEYMTVQMNDLKLRDLIEIELLQEEDQRLKTISFLNSWSTIGKHVPDSFPFEFYSSVKYDPYGLHSKCIHRTKYISLIQNIHARERFVGKDEVSFINTDLLLFHFYYWSTLNREVDIGNCIPYVMDISGNISKNYV